VGKLACMNNLNKHLSSIHMCLLQCPHRAMMHTALLEQESVSGDERVVNTSRVRNTRSGRACSRVDAYFFG